MGDVPSCWTTASIAAGSRAAVLIICALAGTMSIFLGWRLYVKAVVSQTSGDAAAGNYRIKLAAAGPGVFFALFGMAILWRIVERPASFSLPVTESRPSSALTSAAPRHVRTVAADTSKIPAACEQKPCQCMVNQTIVFYTGGALTPDLARAALTRAINEMSNAPSTSDPTESPINRKDAITILRTLRTNINDGSP